ncbi:MAG: DUF3343 domain-containing protein [Syntrophorhabdales bacterium]
MKGGSPYCVALFPSVSHVMKAEKILKEAGIPYKIVPVPKSISSDCGVCVRFLPEQKEAIVAALQPDIPIAEIRCDL